MGIKLFFIGVLMISCMIELYLLKDEVNSFINTLWVFDQTKLLLL